VKKARRGGGLNQKRSLARARRELGEDSSGGERAKRASLDEDEHTRDEVCEIATDII